MPSIMKRIWSLSFIKDAKGGIKQGSKYNVIGKDEDDNIKIARGKHETTLPFSAAKRFSVYEKQELEVAQGDKIRITEGGYSNEKKSLNNGNVLSVKGFNKKGDIIATTSGKNDVTIPKDYGNLNSWLLYYFPFLTRKICKQGYCYAGVNVW